jgi:DNA-binding NarL/FixJ family response regulator
MASTPLAGRADRPIRVTLVNDYEIIVRGLHQMLMPFADRIEVIETEAGGLPREPTDIALFDTFAGRRRSLRRVEAMDDDVRIDKVVLYTWDAPSPFIDDVDRHPVDGVVLKTETGEALVEALERIHRGESIGIGTWDESEVTVALTEREREVLALLATGKSNPQIATELYLSTDTVKTHVRNVFQKLGVANRTQAALEASKYDLIPVTH